MPYRRNDPPQVDTGAITPDQQPVDPEVRARFHQYTESERVANRFANRRFTDAADAWKRNVILMGAIVTMLGQVLNWLGGKFLSPKDNHAVEAAALQSQLESIKAELRKEMLDSLRSVNQRQDRNFTVVCIMAGKLVPEVAPAFCPILRPSSRLFDTLPDASRVTFAERH